MLSDGQVAVELRQRRSGRRQGDSLAAGADAKAAGTAPRRARWRIALSFFDAGDRLAQLVRTVCAAARHPGMNNTRHRPGKSQRLASEGNVNGAAASRGT